MQSRIRLTLALLVVVMGTTQAQNSLWINNPQYTWYWQQGTITEASLTVRPAGLFFQYGLYLTFSASSTNFNPDDKLEVVMDFQLPADATVLDSWLWVGDDIVQGRLIDRWSASDIYEGIVNRRQDPSVLYKNGNNQYQLRVYPIKKNETRKVKITYLVPATPQGGRLEAGLPAQLLIPSNPDPGLHVFVWEDKGFVNPAILSSSAMLTPAYDEEFGAYMRAYIPAEDLNKSPSIQMDIPATNGVYLSLYDAPDAGYYQLTLNPGDFIDLPAGQKLLVILDYLPGNTSTDKAALTGLLKQQLLNNFGEGDRFNLMFSRLRIEKAFDEWRPITEENVAIAVDLLLGGSTYSNLPGLLSEGIEMIKADGGEGSIVLIANSSNFVQYEQANALIKDLKAIQTPLFPFVIADIQDQNYGYNYVGNRYYLGQEYLYTNLAKASGGYFLSIREEKQLTTLFNKVLSSMRGMITAFDIYTAPAEGFCYGRFTSQNLQGFPVTQPVTQIGKYFGEPPFVIYLTGLYQSAPFSQLIQVQEGGIIEADSTLSKSWHGRYIQKLEEGSQNNSVIQEIIYESLSNRVLSKYTAFLCLEPSDTVGICATCKDESRLVGIDVAEQPDPASFIRMFPNPFSDRLTIEIDLGGIEGAEEATVRVFNITGQLLWQRTERAAGGPVRMTWDGRDRSGNSLPAGQYLVMVNAGQMVWSMKAIKSE